MAYELSFTPEFFHGDGVDSGGARNPDAAVSDPPACVVDALAAIPAEEWAEMCADVFGCHPDFVDIGDVLVKIEDTNTCSNLDTPVSVWIDEAGFYTVDVY